MQSCILAIFFGIWQISTSELIGKLEEEQEAKHPYSFAWKSSRFHNGNPDREHIEERGEDGITRGVFRFINPWHKIQELIYVSDDSGFHVDPLYLPQDTPTVAEARRRHLELFNRIKQEHAALAIERHESAEQQEQL